MTIYSEIDSNKHRTWMIVGLFVGLIILLGYIVGIYYGNPGSFMLPAVMLAGLSSFSAYFFSDQLILGLSQARHVSVESNPQIYHTLENLCIGAGVPMPKLYLINDTAPNGFATGRDPAHASIAITTGLLEKLDKLELEGVFAHELSHIKNYDIRLMTIVVVLVGAIALISDWFLRSMWLGGRSRKERSGRGGDGWIAVIGLAAIVLAPFIAQLMKMAVSRRREFLADASGALLTRFPDGLARALEKISADREPLEVANAATAHLYIVNPLKNYDDKIAQLFSTHPPVEERVRRLREM